MNLPQINSVWVANLALVLDFGKIVDPRRKTTKELIGFTSTVDMRWPIVTVRNRMMGYRFLFAEAYWILTGDSRVSTIVEYAPKIKGFSDDQRFFQGAYGPKVVQQLRYVTETLARDPMSRQAVISIWRENPRDSMDIPCTISLQFIIRDDRIHCVATMRSSDLWLGWVYDTFNFTMITAWVALRLKELAGMNLELGQLFLTAGSQHLYDGVWPFAQDCIHDQKAWPYEPMSLSNFNTPDDLMNHLMIMRDKKDHADGIMTNILNPNA